MADQTGAGGIYNSASPLYIELMNPNHFPVNDWVTLSAFYEKLILNDGSYRASIPWLVESWKYMNDVTVVMKLRQGATSTWKQVLTLNKNVHIAT